MDVVGEYMHKTFITHSNYIKLCVWQTWHLDILEDVISRVESLRTLIHFLLCRYKCRLCRRVGRKQQAVSEGFWGSFGAGTVKKVRVGASTWTCEGCCIEEG